MLQIKLGSNERPFARLSKENHEDVEERAIQRFMELQEKLRSFSLLKRYRYERHHLLVSALRCRDRRARWIDRYDLGLEFMVTKETTILKKRQMAMVDWRRALVTGVLPPESPQ